LLFQRLFVSELLAEKHVQEINIALSPKGNNEAVSVKIPNDVTTRSNPSISRGSTLITNLTIGRSVLILMRLIHLQAVKNI